MNNSWKNVARFAGGAGLLISLLSANINAQAGELKGKIIDKETGKGLPFANVYTTIDGENIGVQTDLDGNYVINALPEGEHKVTVEYIGYNAITAEPVTVETNKTSELNITLEEDNIPILIDISVISGISIPSTPQLSVKLLNTNLPRKSTIKLKLYKNGKVAKVIRLKKSGEFYTISSNK